MKIKKSKNVLITSLFFILFILILTLNVNATEIIDKIDINVFIDNNGNANVKETWCLDVKKGKEESKTYTNMSDYEITDFTVFDDSGKEYTFLNEWDSSITFEDKAYKFGISKKGKNIKLYWGISEYGERTYYLEYKILNLVKQYNNAQGIYFNFLPTNTNKQISSANITIESEQDFNAKKFKTWAFGYPSGTLKFSDDGKIIMDSRVKLDSHEYMKILVKMPKKTFDTTNIVKTKFNDVYKEAMKDPNIIEDSNAKNSVDTMTIVQNAIIVVIGIIFIIVFLIVAKKITYALIKKLYSGDSETTKILYDRAPQSIPANVGYSKDIPCSLYRAYWLMDKYFSTNSNNFYSELLSAIMLKWYKEGKIRVGKTKSGILNKTNYAIDFRSLNSGNENQENELIYMLKDAAGENGILEKKEFKKWCEDHCYTLMQWFDKIDKIEFEKLESENFVDVKVEVQQKTIAEGKLTIYKKYVKPEVRELAIKLQRLKKLLSEYSYIYDREPIELHMWDSYLIFAELLGVSSELENQLENISENNLKEIVSNEHKITSYCINDFSNDGINSALKEIQRIEYEKEEYYHSDDSNINFNRKITFDTSKNKLSRQRRTKGRR